MIKIRKAKRGDGKGIAKSFNKGIKRGFNKYTGSNYFFDLKKIKKMEKEFSENSKYNSSFVAIDNGKIVGSCHFQGKEKGRTRHRVNCGWVVHPDYARKGIGTKIMIELLKEAKKRGFKKAEAESAVENKASIKLAKKVGLLLDNGKYVDTYIFGKILR